MAPDNQSPEQNSPSYLRRLLDALPDCLIQLTEAGEILDLNQSAAEIFGYSREELAGRPLTLLMPDEPLEEFRKKLAAWRAGEKIAADRRNLVTKDHRLLPFEINLYPTVTADGELIVQCLAHDLRGRLETERLLQASRELFRALIQSTVDLMFVKDRNGRYTLVNQAFLDWYGRPEDQVLGRTDVELFGEGEGRLLLKKDRDVLLHGQTIREDDAITTHGKVFHFDCTKAPIHNPAGRIIGLVGVARDVTTERALAQQLAQTQKMEAIGTLAGGVAHDFNNLLTALIGHLTTAVAKIARGEAALPQVRAALRTAESTAELTQRLWHLAKSHPAAFVHLALPDLVEENVNLLRSTADRRLRINLHFEPDLWPIRGDRSQIYQVFTNLLHNAQEALECRYGKHFEAPGAQPWIEVTARNLALSGALSMMDARHAKPGEYVRLTVSDNGLGIAPENLGRVFEPFFDARAQAGGGGLGLAMVYAIVSNHGGWITVESEREMGSDFILYFPRAAAEEKTKAEALLPFLRDDLRRHKILVIDDEIEVRHLLQTVLREHGFEVLVAENGAKGWEALQNHRTEVDLIVLDLIMPEMPGRHFIELLRKEGIQIPVLICTGYPSELAMTDLSGLEIEDFIGKPFTPVQFLEKVNDMITRRAVNP